MEATMEVDQQDPELKEWHTFTKARFVMVSRDPLNKGSAIVNRLVAETEEEKALFQSGEGKKKKFHLSKSNSLIGLWSILIYFLIASRRRTSHLNS